MTERMARVAPEDLDGIERWARSWRRFFLPGVCWVVLKLVNEVRASRAKEGGP